MIYCTTPNQTTELGSCLVLSVGSVHTRRPNWPLKTCTRVPTGRPSCEWWARVVGLMSFLCRQLCLPRSTETAAEVFGLTFDLKESHGPSPGSLRRWG